MAREWYAIFMVFLGGVALSVQTPINSALGQASGSGVFAAGVSFFLGFCILAAIALAGGGLPSGEVLRAIPGWMWLGGAFGAFYVWVVLTNVTQSGALSLIAALIAGQLAAALAIDAAGLFGLGVHAVSWQRIAAVLMVGGGVVLSRY